MYLLIAVINDEELLEELITGWLDIGITGSTVIESTDLLQLISYNIPIFAGFRSLTSGGMRHNKTILTAIENPNILDQAVSYLKTICRETGKSHQGIYFVTPMVSFGRLGMEINSMTHQHHVEKKLGRPIKSSK
ncbi:Transcriptional regulator [Candidatus Magnetomoraceae bacterium gMMP-15]